MGFDYAPNTTTPAFQAAAAVCGKTERPFTPTARVGMDVIFGGIGAGVGAGGGVPGAFAGAAAGLGLSEALISAPDRHNKAVLDCRNGIENALKPPSPLN